MNDTQLYQQLLGIESPWRVTAVKLSLEELTVTVSVSYDSSLRYQCPTCAQPIAGYDSRKRQWRDLDSHRCQTLIQADVPRVECPEHGVQQIPVPWAESNSCITVRFERLVIDLLSSSLPIRTVCKLADLSWNAIDRILQRRDALGPRHICVDETSVRRGQRYMTVISDDQTGAVLYVADGRTTGSLNSSFRELSEEALSGIQTTSMDMWDPYIASVRMHVPGADRKICFDRFHIAQHLNRAVDMVRRNEHRMLSGDGDDRLKKTRYLWLYNSTEMPLGVRERFEKVRYQKLQTGKAWALKEMVLDALSYVSRYHGRLAWNQWFN